jgi:hypothetical protein
MLNISADDICFLHLQSYKYAHEYRRSLYEDRKSPVYIDYGSDVLTQSREWK